MAKIIIFGGSSEIGNAIAQKIVEEEGHKVSRILRVSSSLTGDGVIQWKPRTVSDVSKVFGEISFERDDFVIIALGSLGDVVDPESHFHDSAAWNSVLSLNFNFSAAAFLLSYSALAKAGGGTLIVLGSVAAFPVLKSNLFYGTAKLALDSLASSLQDSESTSKVKITIVRSGFVPTKLNKGRQPTPFSVSTEQVASQVYKNLGKKVVWTPSIFKYISIFLRFSKTGRRFAEKRVTNSFLLSATF